LELGHFLSRTLYLRGPLLKRGRGKGKERIGKRKEEGSERNAREGENDLTHPLEQIPGYATAHI